MHSRPLKQAIQLALDTMGMQGPISRRDVARQVKRVSPPDHWSLEDHDDADMAYLMGGVRVCMNQPHSDAFIDQHLANMPDELRAKFHNTPRFICISAGGGRDSQHVMTFLATPEQFDNNFKLKDRVVRATTVSRDVSRDIRDLLKLHNANSLCELFGGGNENDG